MPQFSVRGSPPNHHPTIIVINDSTEGARRTETSFIQDSTAVSMSIPMQWHSLTSVGGILVGWFAVRTRIRPKLRSVSTSKDFVATGRVVAALRVVD